MTSRVGARGRITLDRSVREDLGIQPGWRVLQRRVGNHVELHFLPPPHEPALLGVLADPSGPSFPTEEALQAAMDAALEEDLRAKYGFATSARVGLE